MMWDLLPRVLLAWAMSLGGGAAQTGDGGKLRLGQRRAPRYLSCPRLVARRRAVDRGDLDAARERTDGDGRDGVRSLLRLDLVARVGRRRRGARAAGGDEREERRAREAAKAPVIVHDGRLASGAPPVSCNRPE